MTISKETTWHFAACLIQQTIESIITRALPQSDPSVCPLESCESLENYMKLLGYLGVYYESQPVGLAEVIDASDASLGGPGQTVASVYK